MEALKKILGKIDYQLTAGMLMIFITLVFAYRAGYGDGVNLAHEIPDLKKIVVRFDALNQAVMTSQECQKAILEAGFSQEGKQVK